MEKFFGFIVFSAVLLFVGIAPTLAQSVESCDDGQAIQTSLEQQLQGELIIGYYSPERISALSDLFNKLQVSDKQKGDSELLLEEFTQSFTEN